MWRRIRIEIERQATKGGRWLVIVPMVISIWLVLTMLRGVAILIQNVYLHSYPYVAGAQIRNTYWNSVRYALGGTIALTALLMLLVISLIFYVRSGRRRF